ncbi:metalloendopeptidase OMA1, mitochondrial [Pristis pectinata]|uniref:metalloendopeptidase OMA1, mitochondrial n=1 Tax=Pristis pectinata TaxID=685728 RepID=UPI00223CAA33|nr:metalloendopeptidase OMA1, mitochondrial [Pristis pectinata]
MRTGFWLRDARRHLFHWRSCSYEQNVSAVPERVQIWKSHKMKHQILTTSDGLCCLGRDSEVWRTWTKPNVVLLSCTGHHSVFRNTVHNVGLLSKKPPAINPSLLSFRDFSHCTRCKPAYILSRKCFIPEGTADLHKDFHTTSRVLALPIPLLWILLKPLKKVTAMILGRSIRKWWQALPPYKQELLKEKVKKNKWRILFGLCGLLGVIGMYFWTHLDKSPITGRSRLLVFSKRQFLKLAEFEYQSVLENYKDKFLPADDPVYKTIQSVFNQLVEKNKDVPGVSETTWVINVVEDPEINAFVLPNGQVFILTGLLKAVADADQLACILGHEMAHCLLAHGAEHASIIQLLDFVSLVFLTLTWAVFPRDSLALLGQWIQGKLIQYMFDRPYNRKLEIEADEIGLQLAAKACVDVRASSVYWQQLELMKIASGTFQIPEWFSTHPSNERRVQHLNNLIPKAIKLRENCGCTSLPSIDPRLVFKLSMEEMMKRLKKWEEPICTVSGTEQLPQQHESGPIVMKRIPAVITVQALQSTVNSQK